MSVETSVPLFQMEPDGSITVPAMWNEFEHVEAVTSMIHDSETCDCEMCRWADEVERRQKEEKDARSA